jgi:hypothetical protein
MRSWLLTYIGDGMIGRIEKLRIYLRWLISVEICTVRGRGYMIHVPFEPLGGLQLRRLLLPWYEPDGIVECLKLLGPHSVIRRVHQRCIHSCAIRPVNV